MINSTAESPVQTEVIERREVDTNAARICTEMNSVRLYVGTCVHSPSIFSKEIRAHAQGLLDEFNAAFDSAFENVIAGFEVDLAEDPGSLEELSARSDNVQSAFDALERFAIRVQNERVPSPFKPEHSLYEQAQVTSNN